MSLETLRRLRWGALTLNVTVACFNSYMVYVNWGRLWMFLSASCALASTGVSVLIFRSIRKSKKEVQPSSPSQQPTPGTSPSPSPFAFPSLTITGSLFLSPYQSPSASPSVSQPEKRLMPVVGFRSWRAYPHHKLGVGSSWTLGSQNAQYGVWRPGQNKAVCHAGHYMYGYTDTPPQHHDAPKAECSCGFYVLTDFDKVPFATTEQYQTSSNGPLFYMMVGAVVGWGHVIQHGDEGWRAEKVQVIALLDCKVNDDHLRVTHEAAEAYGVPVLSRTALELLAKEYGDPLPVPALPEEHSI